MKNKSEQIEDYYIQRWYSRHPTKMCILMVGGVRVTICMVFQSKYVAHGIN